MTRGRPGGRPRGTFRGRRRALRSRPRGGRDRVSALDAASRHRRGRRRLPWSRLWPVVQEGRPSTYASILRSPHHQTRVRHRLGRGAGRRPTGDAWPSLDVLVPVALLRRVRGLRVHRRAGGRAGRRGERREAVAGQAVDLGAVPGRRREHQRRAHVAGGGRPGRHPGRTLLRGRRGGVGVPDARHPGGDREGGARQRPRLALPGARLRPRDAVRAAQVPLVRGRAPRLETQPHGRVHREQQLVTIGHAVLHSWRRRTATGSGVSMDFPATLGEDPISGRRAVDPATGLTGRGRRRRGGDRPPRAGSPRAAREMQDV